MNKLWLLGGVALGAVFLAVTARHVDVGQALAQLRGLQVGYALLVVLASLTFIYVKAWRWGLLLSPLRKARVTELAPVVFAGTAGNLLIPHAGEIVRVLMLKDQGNENKGTPVSALLASVAVERMFDFAAVLALIGMVVMLAPELPTVLVSASYFAAVLCALLLGAALLLVYRSAAALRLLGVMTKILPAKLREFALRQAELGIEGLGALRHAHVLAKVAVLSLLQWLTIAFAIHASVQAVGVTPPPAAALTVLGLLVVTLTLPAAPIHVGTTQLGFAVGLAAFGVGSAVAFAASVVYTLFSLLPMLVIGLVYLYRRGLGVSRLARATG